MITIRTTAGKITGSSPLSHEIITIRQRLNLPWSDALKLSRFSPDIIRRIYEQVESNLPYDADYLWAYLFGMNMCAKQKIDPDYVWSDRLIEYAKEQHGRGIPTPPATWVNPDLRDFDPNAPHVFTTTYHADGRMTKNWTYDAAHGYQKI